MARLWAVRKNVTFVPRVLVRMTVNAQMDGGHTYAIVVAGGQERIALVHQEEFSALTEAHNWNIAKIYHLFSFHGKHQYLSRHEQPTAPCSQLRWEITMFTGLIFEMEQSFTFMITQS